MLSYPLRFLNNGCSIPNLRALNVGLLGGLAVLSYHIFQWRFRTGPNADHSLVQTLNDIHSAFNVTLFPLLYFFSGLYYTDIASTLLVVGFLRLNLVESVGNRLFSPMQVLWALCSLTIRQTNIFWVAVFPAGLTLVRRLEESSVQAAQKDGEGLLQLSKRVLENSWTTGSVYDPSVTDAAFEGMHLSPPSKKLLSGVDSNFPAQTISLRQLLSRSQQCVALCALYLPYCNTF